MTATDFIALLEQRAVVAPETTATLRKQIASAPNPVTAAAVASLLVKKGQLTQFQAQQLLSSQPAAKPAPAAAAKPTAAPVAAKPKPAGPWKIPEDATMPASAPAAKPSEDEFGLSPLDEDSHKPAAKTPTKAPPAAKSTAGATKTAAKASSGSV